MLRLIFLEYYYLNELSICVRAFHSESEEELLGMIPSVSKGTPTWPELRELGVSWWVKNDNTLKKLIDKVAKAAFQVSS